MRVWWCALVLAVSLATTALGLAEELKIAYVDLQKALNDSTAGQRARGRFKKQVEHLQVDLKKQKDELEALKGQLEKKAVVMRAEELREMEKEYQRKMRDFERAYKDSQGELQLKDNELTAELIKEIAVVIEAYGRKGGYTIILERSSSSVLYGSPQVDITEDIVKAYNSATAQ